LSATKVCSHTVSLYLTRDDRHDVEYHSESNCQIV